MDELVYCHKCKKKTKNSNAELLQTTNGVWRVAAKCSICKSNKSKFVKTPEDKYVEIKQPAIDSLNDKITEAKELHKDVRQKFTKRKIITLGIDDLWAADLLVMTSFSKENENYKYMLNVIDTFSKFVWIEPLKNKDGSCVTKAFEKILKTAKSVNHKPPNYLHCDKGKEFVNNKFKTMLKKYNIKMYHTENKEKSAIIERFNRTFNSKMKVLFEVRKSFKWIDIVQKILEQYNYNNVHSTIKMKPYEVTKHNENVVFERINKKNKCSRRPEYQIGDHVRISSLKSTFSNKYKHNWTKEIFEISQVLHTCPVTYKIKDLSGEEIQGTFYKQELQRTAF